MAKKFIFISMLATLVAPRALMGAEPSVPPDHAERMQKGTIIFQKEVRTLLSENCLKCHGGEKVKGGFDLSTRESLLKGGDDGAVLVPFNTSESRLLKLIRHVEEPHMPDKKAKLADNAIEAIESWIVNGAPYDRPLIEGKALARDKSVVSEEDRKWWAFQPLKTVEPPKGPMSHPVDGLIMEKAATIKLALAPRADKRTLARRAYLDLLGLPPAPTQIAAFLDDDSPEAWPRLIDELLRSPHYGECWARHWLDVARFAESSGFEHDYDREGAYFYRDFVIKALNSDLSYKRFVEWQLAGDEFEPENPLALSATGFLGAGVFPTQITANEVERTRYDAMDDMLSTTGSAFLGLTVGCARCHDHKYDPIPTRDYYRMLSSFTTTVRSVVDLEMDPERTRTLLAEWQTNQTVLENGLRAHEASLSSNFTSWLASASALTNAAPWILADPSNIVSKAGATFKRLDDGSWLAEGKNGDHDEYTITLPFSPKRVTGLRLEALAHPTMVKDGPGRAENGNFGLSRIRVFLNDSDHELKLINPKADFEQNQSSLSIAGSLDENPTTGWAVDPQFGKDHAAVFTFAEPIEPAEAGSLTIKLDFRVNNKHNIGRLRFSMTSDAEPSLKGDVMPPKVSQLLASRTANGTGLSEPDRSTLFDWWKTQQSTWKETAAKVEEHRKKKPDGKSKVLICGEGYPALRMHTQGADFFNETYLLKRGNCDLKDGVADAGFLQVLMRSSDGEKLWQAAPPAGAKFSGRRRALAHSMTDTESGAGALLARVAVNRLWQHHFGRGIVATPNDFGKAGALPSHPELLDWLAGEFIRRGWSFKEMHRLIMTSETYQQACLPYEAKEKADPNNELFARRIPRRLEGENIRDSILAVSGTLDANLYGPGTKDEKSRRRSIYFTIKRSQLIGSMVAFDQPEPLVSQGARPTTTVAPQALILMNGPQVREWAGAFAKRVIAETARNATPENKVNRAYLIALGRAPRQEEGTDATDFIHSQSERYKKENKPEPELLALTDFCQVLFGLNEFIYEN
jgi:mono/diheme cytochrome c family protein